MQIKTFSLNHSVTQIIPGIFPCLLLVLNVFYFGTFFIYQTNPGEFQITYIQVAASLILPSLGVLAVLLVPAIVLPTRIRDYYVATILMLGVLTYAHCNILLWDYGVLDGNDLDVTTDWRAWVDGAIWLFAAVIVFTYRRRLFDHAAQISGLFILFQIASVGMTSYQSNDDRNISKRIEAFPESLGQFSHKGNVIHLILDAFQANVFEELLDENARFESLLWGFTFFRDATTPSAVTYLSVPASLSGKIFRNDRTISAYQKDAFAGENLYSVLGKNGYEIDIATAPWWNKSDDSFSSYYRIPAPYSSRNQVSNNSLMLVDLSLFKQAPHFLKSTIYNSQNWLLSSSFSQTPGMRFEHFAHNAFLEDLTKRTSVTDRPPVYKFIHVVTPHAPMVSGSDCSFPGYALSYTRSNFKQQSLCTMLTIERLLERLKQLGIYDSSLILIHGDHGGGVPFDMYTKDGKVVSSDKGKFNLWGAPLPLVLVKPPYVQGSLHISNSQVQLSDIPATIGSLLGIKHNFPGHSMYEVEEGGVIERRYYWSDLHRNDAAAKDTFDRMFTYVVRGSVYEEQSWEKGSVASSVVLDERTTYEWDSRITFGNQGTSKLYQVKGWTMTSSDLITWAGGEFAALSLDIPKTGTDIELVAHVKPFAVEGKLNQQRVGVFVGQQKVGDWLVTNRNFHDESVRIPAEYFGQGGPTEIRFTFPDAESPLNLGVSKDARKLGLAFRSLLLRLAD